MPRLALEYKLKLVYKARFDQILSDGYERKNLRQLLEKMQVIDPNLAAAGVVTPAMPPAMWDVCSTCWATYMKALYLGFAFEKITADEI